MIAPQIEAIPVPLSDWRRSYVPSKYEENMLKGEYGETSAFAMECLVKLGEAMDADKMVEINCAHTSVAAFRDMREPELK